MNEPRQFPTLLTALGFGAVLGLLSTGCATHRPWAMHLGRGHPPERKVSENGEPARLRLLTFNVWGLPSWLNGASPTRYARIAGDDFNLVPGTGEYAWLVSTLGPSVHELAGVPPIPTWDGCGRPREQARSIDHIFVRLRTPRGEILAQTQRCMGGSAGEGRLSDHLGLAALLTFRGLGSDHPTGFAVYRPSPAGPAAAAGVRR